jgi:hypothetical protein
MGGSTAEYGMFCVLLLRAGCQLSSAIGASDDIGVLNANCAITFLIFLAALGYCVILDANQNSNLLSHYSFLQECKGSIGKKSAV